MQRVFAKLFLVMLLMFLLAPRQALAMPEIFPFDQVKSGMSGKAYTVIDGSGRIESFDVKIIGLTDDGKGSSRMIMAEASGDLIKRTGGVLQGMSGSPVYIDGKLVGALAATFKEMRPYTFLITPIENMLELWTLPDPKAQVNYFKTVEEVTPEESSDEKISDEEISDEKSSDEKSSDEEILDEEIQPESSNTEEPQQDEQTTELAALYFDGFNKNSINFAARELGFNKLSSVSSTAERGIKLDATLEAGSALGIAIVYGDFSLGATGTVTAVDDKRILALGHSFTHGGNVNYFMTDASVIGSVSGLTGGIKIAGIGNIIGRINQDREAGVSGILGTFPAVVPINVTVKDKTLDKEETFNAIIAYNESLIPKLGAAITYASLNRMADSLAESTVDIDFNIKTNVVSNGELTRQNMFYNSSDVGQVAILELMQALNLICSNAKEESDIFGVDVNISLDTERRTASIVSITPEKKIVKPGETVNLIVELQPYRKPTEKVTVPYTVPLTARQGKLSLEIHGGGLVPVSQAMSNAGVVTADSNKSYEDKIKDFLKMNKNNQLIVEVNSSGEVKTAKQLRKDIAQIKRVQARLKKEGKTVQKTDNKVDTNYIIENVMRTTLSVEKV